ncbi:hypothetical protein [Anabaena sp. UHCC 0399]|nr:hypothetical protein [Anabaena sp. UHCC 0399]MEA5564516.1 hypothetical protein [Anabaena sp. UHCC 0399]
MLLVVQRVTKQRSERDGTNLNIEFTQQKPADLKRIITEAAKAHLRV